MRTKKQVKKFGFHFAINGCSFKGESKKTTKKIAVFCNELKKYLSESEKEIQTFAGTISIQWKEFSP